MKKLFNAIGTAPRVIVAILGVIVAGLVALSLLFLVAGVITAFLGAIAIAIMVATLAAIVFLVAWIVRRPATTPLAPLPPPPPPPGYGPQPNPFPEQQPLHNPEDLR